MKALLLRIGIDTGTDGALGPLFEDGSFEYIPLSERWPSREGRTYGNTLGRNGKPLSTYLPKNISKRMIHFDPEFDTFTYGDPTSKRKYLLKLEEGDLLVFYAGLTPYPKNEQKAALYIVGYFLVERVLDFNQLSEEEIQEYSRKCCNNAHFKRSSDTADLVIVIGDKRNSRLLQKAVLISQTRLDKSGKPYQAVSSDKERLLGISGAIQRSIPPRLINGDEHIANLYKLLKQG